MPPIFFLGNVLLIHFSLMTEKEEKIDMALARDSLTEMYNGDITMHEMNMALSQVRNCCWILVVDYVGCYCWILVDGVMQIYLCGVKALVLFFFLFFGSMISTNGWYYVLTPLGWG